MRTYPTRPPAARPFIDDPAGTLAELADQMPAFWDLALVCPAAGIAHAWTAESQHDDALAALIGRRRSCGNWTSRPPPSISPSACGPAPEG